MVEAVLYFFTDGMGRKGTTRRSQVRSSKDASKDILVTGPFNLAPSNTIILRIYPSMNPLIRSQPPHSTCLLKHRCRPRYGLHQLPQCIPNLANFSVKINHHVSHFSVHHLPVKLWPHATDPSLEYGSEFQSCLCSSLAVWLSAFWHPTLSPDLALRCFDPLY